LVQVCVGRCTPVFKLLFQVSHTNEINVAVDKLQLIQQSWIELGRTRMNTAEYQALINRIRVLSAEFQALVNSPQKPEKSK
jgi:hypothetical protein